MAIDINQIPHRVLFEREARSAVILASGEDSFSGEAHPDVLVATSPSSIIDIDPRELKPDSALGYDLSALEEIRRTEQVHSIMLIVARLDRALMKIATEHLQKRYLVLSELKTLEEFTGRAYVVYAVTHYNPGGRPLGPLTINIGGDCYRKGKQIKDLATVLNRTKDLATAMLRKAVMIFPDIPALHGGKKGEWIILDEDGKKIDGLSEEAIISLGSAIIPRGVHFLNRYKEQQAVKHGVFERFPKNHYIRPDSGSPDVLSGSYWRGEYPDKYINMCEAWSERGLNMNYFTCLPQNLKGTIDSSARPTGYGVATTTIELAKHKFGQDRLKNLRFLLEAAGGVGRNTIEALRNNYGIPKENITVFDVSIGACGEVEEKYGVNTVSLRHDYFYGGRLQRDLSEGKGKYDVWINNGEGNNTKPEHVEELIKAGIRIFTGGANNFLEVKTRDKSLGKIFDNDGWAWPDEATSGGGWTLAVSDILTRCQGKAANTDYIRQRILQIVNSRNRKLVQEVLKGLPDDTGGRRIWEKVDHLIEERVKTTLELELEPEEIFERADTREWELE